MAAWLGSFAVYSWIHFHTLLPTYFAPGRLHSFPTETALFGNLVSPSRGLFVYVPALLAIGLALLRYRRAIRLPGLAGLAMWVMVAHLFMLSGFSHWWGGYSYGARLDSAPERLWSWRRPQFSAPFVEPGGAFLPLPGDGVRLGAADADPYLGGGWSGGEGEFRWTEGTGASTVRFSLSQGGAGVLELDLGAYLGAGKLPEQRLVVRMNDRDLATLSIRDRAFNPYRIFIPDGVGKRENVLRLGHPDAASPASCEGSPDRRKLGVAVRTIAWRSGAP